MKTLFKSIALAGLASLALTAVTDFPLGIIAARTIRWRRRRPPC